MTTTPEQTAADLAAKLGDAAKAFADAEKARAEADKQRADTEKVRADLDADRRLAQNTLDSAAEDLETKRIANRVSRDQATSAHTDKLIEQLTGAVPDLSSAGKSTVSFRDGKALRQGESISAALARVVQDIGAAVVDAVDGTSEPGDVFVVSDPDLVSALAAYSQLVYEATTLKQRVTDAKTAATEALESKVSKVRWMAAEAGLVAAAVAGKAVTQLASLFELDVDVAVSATDIPASSVQAAVIEVLLSVSPQLKVRQAWTRVVTAADSPLLQVIQGLTELDIDATSVGALLDAAIKALGDPATKLAQAEKVAKEDKSSVQEKKDAAKAAEDAGNELEKLAQLQTVQTNLVAVLAKARDFADRVTKPSDAGGPSLLANALAVEPLVGAASKSCVLVLGGAKAETYQAVVKRRIRWPRIQTSTSVEVDYLLVRGEHVVAGGHHTASVAYAGIIDGSGAEWNDITRYAVPEAPPESVTSKGRRLAELDKARESGAITQEERERHRQRILEEF